MPDDGALLRGGRGPIFVVVALVILAWVVGLLVLTLAAEGGGTAMTDDYLWELAHLLVQWAGILLTVLTMYPWWRPLPPKEKKP